jgi:hypothetical protein
VFCNPLCAVRESTVDYLPCCSGLLKYKTSERR